MKSIIVLMLFLITEIAPGKVSTFKKGVFFTVQEDVNALLPACLKADQDDLMQCSRGKSSLTQSDIDDIGDQNKYTLCCLVWTMLDCIDEQLIKSTSCLEDEKNDIRLAKGSYITDVERANCQDHKYTANTYSQCSGTSPVTHNIITLLILIAVMKLFK